MDNFNYALPTQVAFGKDQIDKLTSGLAPYGKRVLLVYGSSSIKQNGLYDKIQELLADFEISELAGVLPNPRLSTVQAGIDLAKQNQVDVILAVGGGSSIDSAKAIAIGAKYNGPVWDFFSQQAEPKDALPLVVIPTIAAAGSETTAGAVISNEASQQKLGLDHPLMIPKLAIMDPTYTMTVPERHTRAGIIDITSHLLEQYLTGQGTVLSNELCEGVLRTVIYYGRLVLQEPDNYEARAQLMWASTLANNGLLTLGSTLYAFSVHGIEHEVSAFYDVVHAEGLAILTPHWLDYILNDQTVTKLAHYGIKVFGLDEESEPYDLAREAIAQTRSFFKDLGAPETLRQVGVEDDRYFEQMAEQAVVNGYLDYAWVPLSKDDVKTILERSL